MWIILLFLLILYFCKESFELEETFDDIFKKDETEDKTPVEKIGKENYMDFYQASLFFKCGFLDD